VRLRTEIAVQHPVVWLSDLLPSEASLELRKASSSIAICRAPQPGSVRILEGDRIAHLLQQQPAVLPQLQIPARVSVRSSGWPIREEEVRDAIAKFLREQGWKNDLPEDASLQWPEVFASSVEPPRLQVAGISWDEPQHMVEARLRCSKRVSCGSFLVRVTLPLDFVSEWRESLMVRSVSGPAISSAAAAGPMLVERGKPATLIFCGGGLRISLPVNGMQGGALNQVVRVFDPASRRVFRAEVVGPGLLRSTL
jgi:hypothetical protein